MLHNAAVNIMLDSCVCISLPCASIVSLQCTCISLPRACIVTVTVGVIRKNSLIPCVSLPCCDSLNVYRRCIVQSSRDLVPLDPEPDEDVQVHILEELQVEDTDSAADSAAAAVSGVVSLPHAVGHR